jgi:hypothetical protein
MDTEKQGRDGLLDLHALPAAMIGTKTGGTKPLPMLLLMIIINMTAYRRRRR